MRVIGWMTVALLAGTLAARAADAGTDPAHTYAWGENVGWINFEQTHGQPAINPANGEFSGHAWGANIGWMSLRGISPEYGVRTLAFDKQPKGTPNWWLAKHGVDEDHDAGDDVPAWRKFVMDVNPTGSYNYLRIVSISSDDSETDVAFTPSSSRRYYTLTRRDDLTAGGWSNVVGQIAVPGIGGEQTLTDEEGAATMFYSVEVKVSP